jgi:hypothetical protein
MKLWFTFCNKVGQKPWVHYDSKKEINFVLMFCFDVRAFLGRGEPGDFSLHALPLCHTEDASFQSQ